MARIKIECFEEDKENIVGSFLDSHTCPFEAGSDKCIFSCYKCLEENIEFVIKEENKDGK